MRFLARDVQVELQQIVESIFFKVPLAIHPCVGALSLSLSLNTNSRSLKVDSLFIQDQNVILLFNSIHRVPPA